MMRAWWWLVRRVTLRRTTVQVQERELGILYRAPLPIESHRWQPTGSTDAWVAYENVGRRYATGTTRAAAIAELRDYMVPSYIVDILHWQSIGRAGAGILRDLEAYREYVLIDEGQWAQVVRGIWLDLEGAPK